MEFRLFNIAGPLRMRYSHPVLKTDFNGHDWYIIACINLYFKQYGYFKWHDEKWNFNNLMRFIGVLMDA